MDYFGLPAQIAALRSELAALDEHDARRIAPLAALAWYLRQRDTRAAQQHADEAQSLLGTLAAQGNEAVRARLALVRAECKWLTERLAEAEALIASARRTFEALHDHTGTGDSYMVEASYHDQKGIDSVASIEAGALCYRRAGDTLRERMSDTWIACVRATRDGTRAEQRFGAALAAAAELAHPGLVTYIEAFRGTLAAVQGDNAAAIAHYQRAFDAALESGQLWSAITLAQNIGIAYSNLSDNEGALSWVERARDLVRPTGWPYATGWCLMETAAVLLGLGRARDARDLMHEGWPALRQFPTSRNYSLGCQTYAETLLELGANEEALRWSTEGERAARELDYPDLLSGILRYKARALSRLGRGGEATAAAEQALDAARSMGDLRRWSTTLRVMAEIARAHRLPAPAASAAASGAIHHLQEALDVAARMPGFTVPPEWLAELSRDHEAAGDVAAALACERQAAAARERASSRRAADLATAMQVRHRTAQAQAEAAHQRALADASEQRAALLLDANATLERLATIGQEITAGFDPQAVFRSLSRHAGELLDAPSLALWRLHRDHLVLAFGEEDGRALPPPHEVALADAQALPARCARERCEQSSAPSGLEHAEPALPGVQPCRSALCMPLIAGGELLGVLAIGSPRAAAYRERERQILRTLSAYGAVALANGEQARRLAAAQAALEHERMQALLVHAGKMVAVGRLASGVVHEMSHPVGTLLLLAESMQAEASAGTPKTQRMLAGITREARRLQQLVRRLRDFSRSEAPQLAVHDLRAVLEDAHQLYAPRLSMEKIDYRESVPALAVRADPERLSLVIANLVFNAADAMEGAATKVLSITARQHDGAIELAVQDSGAGLSDAVRERLFEPFFTTKPQGKGLGLGLALSAASLAVMQGRIEAGNAPEGGARFCIHMPAVKEAAQQPP